MPINKTLEFLLCGCIWLHEWMNEVRMVNRYSRPAKCVHWTYDFTDVNALEWLLFHIFWSNFYDINGTQCTFPVSVQNAKFSIAYSVHECNCKLMQHSAFMYRPIVNCDTRATVIQPIWMACQYCSLYRWLHDSCFCLSIHKLKKS